MANELRGARALVIGATGFIGRRLVERLVLEQGAEVRVLARKVMGAAPLARLPIDVAIGDILDAQAVLAAADGCRVIFNCTKGKGGTPELRRAVDTDGVRNVVAAAQRVGARVVHLSTMAVYDLPRDGVVTEETPAAANADPYTANKIAGERSALELGTAWGVPVAVMQPTVVYGPWAGVHGAEIFEELRTTRMPLINGGDGICNAVYVDDLVSALLRAAVDDRAAGQRFLISGAEHPTWREFYAAFEHMLGIDQMLPMTEAEALARWRRSQRRPWLVPETLRALKENEPLRRRLLATREGPLLREITGRLPWQRLVPGRQAQSPTPASTSHTPQLPVATLRPWLIGYLASKPRVQIDKARRLLDYTPVFGLADGMRLTEQWARWARLIR